MNYAAPGTAAALDAAPLPVEAHAEDNVVTIDLRQTALLRVKDGVLTIGAEAAETLARDLDDAVTHLMNHGSCHHNTWWHERSVPCDQVMDDAS